MRAPYAQGRHANNFKRVLEMKKVAFIDEYGDPSLEIQKEGVTNNYIVAAVLVNENKVVELRKKAEKVSEEYFSGTELKSSSIGKVHWHRKLILQDLVVHSHHIHILSVDKSKILESSGLIYKRPFLKYIQSILHKRLCLANPKIDIFLDEHGSEEFQKGFTDYVARKNYQSDLFSEVNFKYKNSEHELGIQVADIYAGSVARVFDPKKFTDNAKELLNIIRPIVLSMEHWPPRLKGFVEPPEVTDKNQEKIRSTSQRTALLYLEENYEATNDKTLYRCETLNYLLFRLQSSSLEDFAPSHELIDTVNQLTKQDLSDQQFRAKIIGPLRDLGIMIVSNSNGYKIAEKLDELTSFVNEVDRRVKPQIERIGTFREGVLSTTDGEVDIFEGYPEYLEAAINSIKEST